MNFINPIGRTPETMSQPRACMCFNTSGFQTARGNDTCARCGCHCQAGNTSNFNSNANIARTTNRRS